MKKEQAKIRLNQIYKSKRANLQVIISGKSGDKWKARILTDKPGVYAGTHTLAKFTIRRFYELQE